MSVIVSPQDVVTSLAKLYLVIKINSLVISKRLPGRKYAKHSFASLS